MLLTRGVAAPQRGVGHATVDTLAAVLGLAGRSLVRGLGEGVGEGLGEVGRHGGLQRGGRAARAGAGGRGRGGRRVPARARGRAGAGGGVAGVVAAVLGEVLDGGHGAAGGLAGVLCHLGLEHERGAGRVLRAGLGEAGVLRAEGGPGAQGVLLALGRGGGRQEGLLLLLLRLPGLGVLPRPRDGLLVRGGGAGVVTLVGGHNHAAHCAALWVLSITNAGRNCKKCSLCEGQCGTG